MPAAQIISTADLVSAQKAAAPVDEVLPADPRAPSRARRLVCGLEGCRLPPERVDDVRLVVTEAVSNAVVHAYASGEPGTVHLKAWALDDSLAVLVSDSGCGFDTTSTLRGAGTGLGMGISLMRSAATEMTIVSSPMTGTAVLMILRR